MKSLKTKTDSCIDYNDNCKGNFFVCTKAFTLTKTGLIYNYISMVDSLPSISAFSQVLDKLFAPEPRTYEAVSTCKTPGASSVNSSVPSPSNKLLSYSSPEIIKEQAAKQAPSRRPPVNTKQVVAPSILDDVSRR